MEHSRQETVLSKTPAGFKCVASPLVPCCLCSRVCVKLDIANGVIRSARIARLILDRTARLPFPYWLLQVNNLRSIRGLRVSVLEP